MEHVEAPAREGARPAPAGDDPLRERPPSRHGRRTRRLRRWLVWAAAALVLSASVAVATAVSLTRIAPTWWRTVHRDDSGTAARARVVEDAVYAAIYRDRGPAPARWAMDLRAADANAWLNTRLPKWLANHEEEFRWPASIAEVQVDFDEQDIRIGARVVEDGTERFISATLTPVIDDDGSLWMRARWVHIGRLSLPAALIMRRAADHARDVVPDAILDMPETSAMLRALAGEIPLIQDTERNLRDGRHVRVIAVEPRGGVLRVVCQTELVATP